MRINQNIPGQMTRIELEEVAFLAGLVPEGGTIVETGSLLGLSAWHWASNCHPSVKVFCIDPWERHKWIRDKIEGKMGTGEFGVELFKKNVADCPNIIPIQGYSPDVVKDTWDTPVDLYFEDSVHTNPILLQNIEFWGGHVRSGGIIAGHDFCDEWPDVKREGIKLAKAFDVKLNTCGSIWWVQKP